MKTIMLKNQGLCVKTRSKFEEDFLNPIIAALKEKKFSIYISTNDNTGHGFMTIYPKENK